MKMGQVEKKMHDTVSGSMRDFHCARNEPKERTQGEGICLLGCSDCTKWPLVTSTRARRQDRGMGGREGYGVFHMPLGGVCAQRAPGVLVLYSLSRHINGNSYLVNMRRILGIPQVSTPYATTGTDGHGVCEMCHKERKMGTYLVPTKQENLQNWTPPLHNRAKKQHKQVSFCCLQMCNEALHTYMIS